MNREIKFRVFCTLRKQMITIGVDGSASFNHDGTISTHGVLGENTLMQYTGLKDKNGVEIYEGDIVEDSEERYHINFGDWQYDECSFIGFYLENKNVVFGLSYDDGAIFEIIGNIYQHKELLQINRPQKEGK